jgi:hypothetical protein
MTMEHGILWLVWATTGHIFPILRGDFGFDDLTEVPNGAAL